MYIAELLRDSDTIGISETWLRPGELSIAKDTLLKSPALSNLNDEDLVVFAKSGMCDVDACYTGRPYGGIAVACKPRDSLCYTELAIQSDRVIEIKVCNNATV